MAHLDEALRHRRRDADEREQIQALRDKYGLDWVYGLTECEPPEEHREVLRDFLAQGPFPNGRRDDLRYQWSWFGQTRLFQLPYVEPIWPVFKLVYHFLWFFLDKESWRNTRGVKLLKSEGTPVRYVEMNLSVASESLVVTEDGKCWHRDPRSVPNWGSIHSFADSCAHLLI